MVGWTRVRLPYFHARYNKHCRKIRYQVLLLEVLRARHCYFLLALWRCKPLNVQTLYHYSRFIENTMNSKERCDFNKHVILYCRSVVRCLPRLYAPAGGSKHCTMDNMYGSECSFRCQPGYIMLGSAKRACENNQTSSFGFWTGNDTMCECKLYITC